MSNECVDCIVTNLPLTDRSREIRLFPARRPERALICHGPPTTKPEVTYGHTFTLCILKAYFRPVLNCKGNKFANLFTNFSFAYTLCVPK